MKVTTTSETKIQLNQRKIRKGIRKSTEAQQKQMWEKLSTASKLESVLDPSQTYTVTCTPGKNVWYYPPKLRGQTFDKIIIDEWVK